VRLDWALIANAAEGPPNGLVYILGAGVDTLWRESFPAPFGVSVVIRVVGSRSEAGRPHIVEVLCNDEDGHPVIPQAIRVEIPARAVPTDYPLGWDLASQIVLNLTGVPIPRAGIYAIEILLDGQLLRTLQFRAVQGRPG
jgi:hypothetical protein